MTGDLIPLRALRPDGSEAARGPLRADVIAEAVKVGGAPWHILVLKGWRVEMDLTGRAAP